MEWFEWIRTLSVLLNVPVSSWVSSHTICLISDSSSSEIPFERHRYCRDCLVSGERSRTNAHHLKGVRGTRVVSGNFPFWKYQISYKWRTYYSFPSISRLIDNRPIMLKLSNMCNGDWAKWFSVVSYRGVTHMTCSKACLARVLPPPLLRGNHTTRPWSAMKPRLHPTHPTHPWLTYPSPIGDS